MTKKQVVVILYKHDVIRQKKSIFPLNAYFLNKENCPLVTEKGIRKGKKEPKQNKGHHEEKKLASNALKNKSKNINREESQQRFATQQIKSLYKNCALMLHSHPKLVILNKF